MSAISKKCRTFAPAIGTLPSHTIIGVRHSVGFKRESGEKPGQSRCCKCLFSLFSVWGRGMVSTMVTDIFSGRPLAMSLRMQVRRPAVAIGRYSPQKEEMSFLAGWDSDDDSIQPRGMG